MRGVSLAGVEGCALLIQNVGMHTEPLQQLLALLVRLLPLLHTHRALAPHQAIEHQVVLMRNPLIAFFFRPRVQASNLFRSYTSKLVQIRVLLN